MRRLDIDVISFELKFHDKEGYYDITTSQYTYQKNRNVYADQ
jgi:hypothetical protein